MTLDLILKTIAWWILGNIAFLAFWSWLTRPIRERRDRCEASQSASELPAGSIVRIVDDMGAV